MASVHRVREDVPGDRARTDAGQGEEAGEEARESIAEHVDFGDTPHSRKMMTSMSIDEMEKLVILIRNRRALAAERTKRAASISRNARTNAVAFRLQRFVTKAERELAALDKKIAAVEDTITKIRVTLIELGEDGTW